MRFFMKMTPRKTIFLPFGLLTLLWLVLVLW